MNMRVPQAPARPGVGRRASAGR